MAERARAVESGPPARLDRAPLFRWRLRQLLRRRHIDHTARRDVLTDLANRATWEESIAACEESDSSFGVLFADVDGLKTANDVYGHEMGDRLLIAVADVLTSEAAVMPAVFVARIDGDEFALLVPDTSRASIEALASSLRARFRVAPVLDCAVPISASVGHGFARNGGELGTAIAAAEKGANMEKVNRGVRRR